MKNEYEVRGDVTAIIINSPKHGRIEALISTNKLKKVKEFPTTWVARWDSITKTFYVYGNVPKGNGKYESIYLHRWITDAEKYIEVDHIDHNGLNNTDENLRLLTRSQNAQNRKGAYSNSKTGIRGVSWDKRKQKWCVRVKADGAYRFFGYFDDINQAEITAKEARKKYLPYSQEALAE